jgi:hypothetical protein
MQPMSPHQRIPLQADIYGAAFLERFTLAASIGMSNASARYEHSSKARAHRRCRG